MCCICTGILLRGGLSLPRVISRKGISHETVTERDKGGWVVLKTQILSDVIIEQPQKWFLRPPCMRGFMNKGPADDCGPRPRSP